MANIMTKRGQQDNIVTYEHICDTHEDMANIHPSYITLGSVCIVVQDIAGGLGVYIANTRKQWNPLISESGGSGSGASAALQLHVCTTREYDEGTYLPIISNPRSDTLYLVPYLSNDNDRFKEYVYINGLWERVGSGGSSTSELSQEIINKINAAYTHSVAKKGRAFAEGLYKITTNEEGHVIETSAVTATDIEALGISAGITSYEDLTDKPSINGTTLSGDKSLDILGIQPEGNYPQEALTEDDINYIINRLL